MQCKIVNRRGHPLHFYIGSRVNSKDEEVLCIRGWEETASHDIFGGAHSPKDQVSYPHTATWYLDATANSGQTHTVALPGQGGIFWLRNAVMVGPWFLTAKHSNPWHAVYRTDESRLVVLPNLTKSDMVLGIDGLLRHVEEQLAGRIRPKLDGKAVADAPQASGEEFLIFMGTSLLNAAATATAALGPIGALPSGAFLMSGALVTSLADQSEPQPSRIQLDAFKARMQSLFDDLKAREAVTTIGNVQRSLEEFRDHFIELVLRTEAFSDSERALYYDWTYRKIADNQKDALRTLLAKIETEMANFVPEDGETKDFSDFVDGAVDTNAYGNLYWAMQHMLNEPSIRRFALPEFMLGAGLLAQLSVADLAFSPQKGVTPTPANYHDPADLLEEFNGAVSGTITDVVRDMHQVIDDNHLNLLPERIEILRFFSERLFDSADALRDPLLCVALPHSIDSFGVTHGAYWVDTDGYSRAIGPVVGTFRQGIQAVIDALRKTARDLELVHARQSEARQD